MGNKDFSYEECVKKHLTGEERRFYKRSECPIPNSMYTLDIVNDYMKALTSMGVDTSKVYIKVQSFMRRIPHEYKTEPIYPHIKGDT